MTVGTKSVCSRTLFAADSTPWENDAFVSFASDVPLPQRDLGDVRYIQTFSRILKENDTLRDKVGMIHSLCIVIA